jgi:Leucine-rich repeat (LRR) protein
MAEADLLEFLIGRPEGAGLRSEARPKERVKGVTRLREFYQQRKEDWNEPIPDNPDRAGKKLLARLAKSLANFYGENPDPSVKGPLRIEILRGRTSAYQPKFDWLIPLATVPPTVSGSRFSASTITNNDAMNGVATVLDTSDNFEVMARAILLAGHVPPPEWLSFVHKLDFRKSNFSKLELLQSLIHLQELYLDSPEITEVVHLACLSDLVRLDLDRAKIRDLDPLVNLKKLTTLSLYEGVVSEISPIGALRGLKVIDLRGTPLQDISSR